MLNGFNSLKEIVDQLLEIIGLKWLMNLVQNIINLFGDNIKSARLKLENTLSPVYFSDTKEYENTIEALESLLEGVKMSDDGKTSMSNISELLENVKNDDIDKLIGSINSVKNITVIDPDKDKSNVEKIENLLNDMESQGDVIVAYKSPIIEEPGKPSKVSESRPRGLKTLSFKAEFISATKVLILLRKAGDF